MAKDSVFKPAFYSATLVFSMATLVVVMLLGGIMIAQPAARAGLSVFVPTLAVGGAVIVAIALLRIRSAEAAYVRLASGEDSSNAMLGCPDDYVANNGGCEPRSAEFGWTSDSVLAGKHVPGTRFTHTARATAPKAALPGKDGKPGVAEPAFDVAAARYASRGEFVAKYCKNQEWRDLPWAMHKALCPVAA